MHMGRRRLPWARAGVVSATGSAASSAPGPGTGAVAPGGRTFPAGTGGSKPRPGVAAAVDDVWAGEVADRGAEGVHEAGEGPECEEGERHDEVEFEPDGYAGHLVRVGAEVEQ